MCTYEFGPSFLVKTLENGVSMAEISESLSLKSWIDEDPSVPGDKVVEKWGVNLPFVFKELKDVLQNVLEIAEVVGHSAFANQVLDINYQDGEEKLKAFVQSIFTQLMYASKDVSSMLTYKQGFPEILQGVPLNPYTKRYILPSDEFEVDHCILPWGASTEFAAINPWPFCFCGHGGRRDNECCVL